jgi:hypothetical protein
VGVTLAHAGVDVEGNLDPHLGEVRHAGVHHLPAQRRQRSAVMLPDLSRTEREPEVVVGLEREVPQRPSCGRCGRSRPTPRSRSRAEPSGRTPKRAGCRASRTRPPPDLSTAAPHLEKCLEGTQRIVQRRSAVPPLDVEEASTTDLETREEGRRDDGDHGGGEAAAIAIHRREVRLVQHAPDAPAVNGENPEVQWAGGAEEGVGVPGRRTAHEEWISLPRSPRLPRRRDAGSETDQVDPGRRFAGETLPNGLSPKRWGRSMVRGNRGSANRPSPSQAIASEIELRVLRPCHLRLQADRERAEMRSHSGRRQGRSPRVPPRGRHDRRRTRSRC